MKQWWCCWWFFFCTFFFCFFIVFISVLFSFQLIYLFFYTFLFCIFVIRWLRDHGKLAMKCFNKNRYIHTKRSTATFVYTILYMYVCTLAINVADLARSTGPIYFQALAHRTRHGQYGTVRGDQLWFLELNVFAGLLFLVFFFVIIIIVAVISLGIASSACSRFIRLVFMAGDLINLFYEFSLFLNGFCITGHYCFDKNLLKTPPGKFIAKSEFLWINFIAEIVGANSRFCCSVAMWIVWLQCDYRENLFD